MDGISDSFLKMSFGKSYDFHSMQYLLCVVVYVLVYNKPSSIFIHRPFLKSVVANFERIALTWSVWWIYI